MKRCTRCATEYYDEMLEFYLEDGAKLYAVSRPAKVREPEITADRFASPLLTEKTLDLQYTEEKPTIESIKPAVSQKTIAKRSALEVSSSAFTKILETAPLVVALAHNWWQ